MITELINGTVNRLHTTSKPSRLLNFALFRVFFFGHILLTIYNVNIHKGLIFDSIQGITKNPFPFNTFLWVWGLGACCMAIGILSKYMAVVNYICVVFAYQLFNRSGIASYYSDLMLMGSFLSLFFPVSKAYSVDALLKKVFSAETQRYTIPSYQYTLFAFLTLGLMYLGSGITKLGSPIWQQGIGLWIPLNMPFFKWHSMANHVADWIGFLRFINYVVIIWEILFVFALFANRLRPAFIIIGIIFHIGIASFFYFPEIALATLIFYIPFIPDSAWEKISSRLDSKRKQLVFVPPANPLSNRAWAFLSGIDFRQRFVKVSETTENSIPLDSYKSFTSLLGLYAVYAPIALFIQSGAYRGIQRFLNYALNRPSTPSNGMFTYSFKVYILICFTIFVTSIQCYVSLRFFVKQLQTPPSVHLSVKPSQQSFNFTRPSQLPRVLMGISSRGLFLDNGIAAKRTMVTIIYTNSLTGREQLLPLVNLKGYHTNGDGAWTKTYSHFLYQTNPLSRKGLEKVIRYWSSKNNLPSSECRFTVLKREYPESNHYEPGYWQKMEQLPWDTAGIAFLENDSFRYVPVLKDGIPTK